MPILNKNILFIHIPRTAGTSLEEAAGLHRKHKEFSDTFKDHLFGLYKYENNCFALQHVTFREIEIHDLHNFESIKKSFSVVRNPYDRCVSLFFYWKGDTNFGNFQNFLTVLEKLKLNEYDHQGIGGPADLENIANRLKSKDIKNLQQFKYHFIPQYHYLCDENQKFLVDNIFRYENINSLKSVIGFGKSFWFLLNYDRRKLMETRKRNITFYTDSTLERVYKIYKKDFEVFNYSKDYLEIPNLDKKNNLQSLLTYIYLNIKKRLKYYKKYFRFL